MGQKYAAKLTLADFRTRAMIEWLTCFKISLEAKKILNSSIKISSHDAPGFLEKKRVTA